MRYVHPAGDPSAPASRRDLAGLIGFRTCFAVGACALVGTAYALGADWLGAQVLLLPAGLWLILAGLGGVHIWMRSSPRTSGSSVTLAHVVTRLLGAPAGMPVRDMMRFRAREVGELLRFVISGPFGKMRGAAPARKKDSAPAPRAACVLRVGLDMPRRESEALTHALTAERVAGLSVEVTRLHTDLSGAPPAPLGLDAVVRSRPSIRDGESEFTIAPCEHQDGPGAWPDWACRLPLGYASVFPGRIDPAIVSCGRVTWTDVRACTLLSRVTMAACVLARAAHDAAPRLAEPVMTRLALTVATDGSALEEHARDACAAAARALGAWLSTSDCSTLDAQERRALVEACSRVLGPDNESLLQVAAARIGAGADAEAVGTLCQVYTLLRASPPGGSVADPLPFILAELQLGPPGPLTLGRLAAGLCLLWATSTPEHLAYLRDDLTDELRYASRLVGNDPDHRLLLEIIATLDRQRPEARRTRLSEAA